MILNITIMTHPDVVTLHWHVSHEYHVIGGEHSGHGGPLDS